MTTVKLIPLQYYDSKDTNGQNWLNSYSATDQHIQNCSYFINTLTTNNTAYYEVVKNLADVVKKVWVLYTTRFEVEDDVEYDIQFSVILYDENYNVLSSKNKVYTLQNKFTAYVLTSFDFDNVENVKYIRCSYQWQDNISFNKLYIGIYTISVNNKWFEPIIEQDEFVYLYGDYMPVQEIIIPGYILWGSFGWGDFGETYFGKGVRREL